MASHTNAETFLGSLSRAVSPIALAAHNQLIAHGCSTYVKTIYVGYDLGGDMTAALYGHADHVEIALALAEDFEHDLLVEVSHLTWRTLPVAALLRSPADAKLFGALAKLACERVGQQTHDVERSNDYFIRSGAERRRLMG